MKKYYRFLKKILSLQYKRNYLKFFVPFSLKIPKDDITFLKSLVKRMGWTIHTTTMKRSAYEQALLMINHIVI